MGELIRWEKNMPDGLASPRDVRRDYIMQLI